MTQQAWLDDPSLTDHALLSAAVDDQRIEQAARFRRVARWAELARRCHADAAARRADQPHFTLAPMREVVIETGPLSGFSEGRIRGDVNAVQTLATHVPQLLAWGLEGRIDLFRARVVTDAVTIGLADDLELISVFAAKMTEWFAAHLAGLEAEDNDGQPVLIVKTREQIQRRAAYLIRKLRTARANEEFRRAFADRRVDKRVGDDGMGGLTLTHDAVTVTAINRHLDLLARDARRKGDPRTLAQLRADFAADLLLGRITITEHGEIVEQEVGRWARPVINVTVPLATLAGAGDEPGVLNGTTHLPAALVRAVAQDPTSTWYRLVTDPLRGIVELSVQGYRPSDPLWREVVARWGTCFGPTCDIPASEVEIDNNVPFPEGPTAEHNLAPGCSRHHPAKHTRGAAITTDAHGVRRWRTRAGFTHLLEPDHLHLEPLAFLGYGFDDLENDAGEHDDARPADQTAAGPPVELLADLADLHPTGEELRAALAQVRLDRRAAEVNAWQLRRDLELFTDYRAAYPDISDEAIADWIDSDPYDGPDPESWGPPDRPPHVWTPRETALAHGSSRARTPTTWPGTPPTQAAWLETSHPSRRRRSPSSPGRPGQLIRVAPNVVWREGAPDQMGQLLMKIMRPSTPAHSMEVVAPTFPSRRGSRIALVVVAALIAALVVVTVDRRSEGAHAAAPAPAPAAAPAAAPVTCGQTILVSTTLTNDLTNCPGNGLVIGRDSITLNLNGHTIDGTGAAASGVGVVASGRKSVIVTGGTIKQFDTGVRFNTASTSTVRSIRLTENGIGVQIGGGNGNTVTLNNSYSNTYGAQVYGIASKVTSNTFASNTSYGLALFFAGAQSNVVTGNHALNNGGVGIFLDTVVGVTLTSNVANGNGLDGIRSNNSPLVTMTTNTTSFNGQLGLNASPGTTDGNGNKAQGNGNARQCANVVCS